MKDSKIKWGNHAPESVSVVISMGALLLFFEQPLILIVVISVMFGLIMLIMSMMSEFITLSIEVDMKMDGTGRQRYYNLLNHMKKTDDVITRHLIQHKNPDYGKATGDSHG